MNAIPTGNSNELTSQLTALVDVEVQVKKPLDVSNTNIGISASIEDRQKSNVKKDLTHSVDESKVSFSKEKEQSTEQLAELKNGDNGDEIAESLQKIMQSKKNLHSLQARQIDFVIDSDYEGLVVKVIDKEKGDIIRQIPSEEFLRVADRIKELSDELSSAQGLLFDSKV